MTSDLDIYRTASVLIREHGGDAALEAAQQADATLDKGSLDGQRVWKRVLAAAGLEKGPVFRWVNRHGQLQDGRLSDKAVAKVVKRTAFAAALAKGADETTAQASAAPCSIRCARSFSTLWLSPSQAGATQALMAFTGGCRNRLSCGPWWPPWTRAG
jgi:hypothetical protein